MRAALRRDVRERGSMTPVIAVLCLALAALGIGGATAGRLAAVRMDAQRAADAAALAAAQIIKEEGLPFTPAKRAAAEAVARRNSQLPMTFSWILNETGTYVEFSVRVTIEMPAPKLIYPTGGASVQARAKGRVSQSKFDEATRRLPKLVMVLDYSGSMNATMPGSGGKRAITVLEENVNGLLDLGLQIDYAAVFYSTNVFATVGFGPGAPAAIKSKMAMYDAGGSTNTGGALQQAKNFLDAAEDTGRYVLLVSDGAPCCTPDAVPKARAAADQLWAAPTKATVYSLEIRHSGTNPAMTEYMKYAAKSPPNSNWYLATDASTLASVFKSIVASIVCSVGPLSPAPTDPSKMKVFLRTPAGSERSIPGVTDLAANAGIEAYRYDGPTATVRLTQTACTAVIDYSNQVVVRAGGPTLVE